MATYFCLPDGTVLHAVAGPVNAQKFMQEARFAVETHKLAAANSRNDPFKYRLTVRASHYDKLKDEGGVLYPPAALPGLRHADTATDEPLRLGLGRRLGNAGKVSALLTAYPLARLETRGWIASLPAVERRRPYRLTAAGAGILREQLAGMERLAATGLERLAAS